MKKMSEKVYYLVELIISMIFMLFGISIVNSSSIIQDYLQYIMVSYILIKIVQIFLSMITFKISASLSILQMISNAIIIVLLFIFKKVDALSFVVSASIIVDFVSNIIKSVVYKKTNNSFLQQSFFGMENIISIIFFIVLIFNKDNNLLTAGVLFGVIILYKGISTFLNNGIIRRLFNLTDFGQSLFQVHGVDIFCALAIIVVLASAIFPFIEEDIKNTSDALWYCFTLITTIGTGEIVAKTTLGRFISVVIGCYGIILVSILTSAIVVYLNKLSRKKDKR